MLSASAFTSQGRRAPAERRRSVAGATTGRRDSCIAYFQTFSRRPLPPGYAPPEHPAAWYEAHPFPSDLYR